MNPLNLYSIIVIIFLSCFTYAQKVNYSTRFKIDSTFFESTPYYTKVNDSTIGFKIDKRNTNTITINYFNSKTGKFYKTLNINYNLFKEKDILYNFCERKDTLILLTFKHIMVFVNTKTTNVFNLAYKVDRLDRHDKVYLKNDTIILTDCYNHHDFDSKIKCGVALYKLSDLSFIKNIALKTDAVCFTHLVNNFLHYCNGKFIITNTLNYKAYIYNLSGNIIDSIGTGSYFNKEVKALPVNCNFCTENVSVKDTIYKLSKFSRGIKRIEKCFFINDSTVLFSIKPASNKDNRIIEIWTYAQEKWQLKTSTTKLNSIKNFKWNYSNELLFFKNKLYNVDLRAPQFKWQVTDHYLEKYPNFYLYEYKTNF